MPANSCGHDSHPVDQAGSPADRGARRAAGCRPSGSSRKCRRPPGDEACAIGSERLRGTCDTMRHHAAPCGTASPYRRIAERASRDRSGGGKRHYRGVPGKWRSDPTELERALEGRTVLLSPFDWLMTDQHRRQGTVRPADPARRPPGRQGGCPLGSRLRTLHRARDCRRRPVRSVASRGCAIHLPFLRPPPCSDTTVVAKVGCGWCYFPGREAEAGGGCFARASPRLTIYR